jgi:glycosyltransferase involved in cell wall biosynthesis
VGLIPDNSDLQKLSWLIRMCKRVQRDYDVLVTADCEVDFGRPGIQYVHYPYLAPHARRLSRYGSLRAWRVIPALLLRVYRPWMMISGFSFRQMRRNLTLANSKWTAERFRAEYGQPASVLYPPAAGSAPGNSWDDRRDEFICLSRLEPMKNHLRMIEILRRVREFHPQFRFHIVGTRARNASGDEYYKQVRELAARHGDWIELHEDLSRQELSTLFARVRYGLHLMLEEHFGMAVAEMLRAGLIPFVHNSGGQTEIVNQPELLFNDDEEAVERIRAVLEDAPLRARMLAALDARRIAFSPEQFCEDLTRLVEEWRLPAPG